jgi:hypothetical protein
VSTVGGAGATAPDIGAATGNRDVPDVERLSRGMLRNALLSFREGVSAG